MGAVLHGRPGRVSRVFGALARSSAAPGGRETATVAGGCAAAFGLQGQGAIDARDALTAVLVAAGVNSASRGVVAVATGGAAYGARVGAALGASWSAGALGLWVSLRLMTLGP